MSERLKQSRVERQFEKDGLLNRYKNYLKVCFGSRVEGLLIENLMVGRKYHEQNETLINRVIEIIYRNNLIAHILQSQEFAQILEGEKLLKGDAKVGAVICIDGRLALLQQFGRAVNAREIAGSLIALDESGKLNDRRFIGILEQTADDGRELLQIVTAHTSLRHQNHRCGRITVGVTKNEFEGEIDEVALGQAELRAKAIEDKYNQILQKKGKQPQQQVSIIAMIDTDSMGLIFNFEKDNSLSTTDLTLRLKEQIEQQLNGEVGKFGSMQRSFTDPAVFIDYSRKVLRITQYLIQSVFSQGDNEVRNYINNNFSQLTETQKQALLFIIARTVANQYVTGLASTEDQVVNHLFAEHDEDYLVVSPAGKPLGRFDISRQSFGSAPASREEALEQVLTKLSILDKNRGESAEPDILFISAPLDRRVLDKNDTTRLSAEDAAKAHFQFLMANSEIKKRIANGQLVIIPVLTDEDAGEVLMIRDYSIYL